MVQGEPRMKDKKGLVISLSTMLIFIVVVWFAAFYSGKVERQEQSILESFAIEKAGFVADDIIWDVNQMLGTGQDINKGPNNTTIRLNDKIPADTNKMQLIDYNAFVDGNYARMQNASIKLNFEKLVDGKTEMIFNNGLQYEYAYNKDQNFVLFRKGNGSNTGAESYDINLFVRGARLDTATAWNCDANQDVNVSLRYSDSYGESTQTLGCEQNPSLIYTYTFTFQEIEGSLTATFGSVDGNINAVKIRNRIQNPNIEVFTSIQAQLPSTSEELEWFYNADLNYAQEDVNLNRKILLGKA